MFSRKSVLARLLANENISVVQGNFETASFDVVNRTLNLPMWKDMGRDIYDMLVGHEVAHALYTPENFFEYNEEGVPHSWYNIVEDVRIEKMILRKYPGLVANFKRGYNALMFDHDLFGIKDKDISLLPFMDRLNIHTKLRDLIAVSFSDEEMVYVAKAKACETYEDVATVCREIREWLGEEAEKQNQAEQTELNDDADSNYSSMSSGSESDMSSDDEGEESGNAKGSSGEEAEEEGEETSEDSNSGNSGEETSEDAPDSDSEEKSEKGEGDTAESKINSNPEDGLSDGNTISEAMTDVNYHNNASSLVEDINKKLFVRGVTREEAYASVIPYAKVAEARRVRNQQLKGSSPRWWQSEIKNYGTFPESDYVTFIKETKQVVNLMVKEFEMRKAAYRSARARTSTRGSLDVNKLHSYKYNDHLFKQVSQLADAKNHGMMMLIDYSGSMAPMLPSVIRQMLALTMFCKRVGIPFEVYSFTSMQSSIEWKEMLDKKRAIKEASTVTRFNSDELAMCELMSSSLSKRDYEESFKMMFWQSVVGYESFGSGCFEDMGNTPLNAALQASQYLIQDFRKKYAVQKMNFVTLTDGDSNNVYIRYGKDLDNGRYVRRPNTFVVDVNGKKIEIDSWQHYGEAPLTTGKFVKLISDMGVTTINYFIAARKSDLRNEVRRTCGWGESEKQRKANKDVREKGVFCVDNNFGYDRRFILLGETEAMRGQTDALEVESSMTPAKIAKAFNKSNGSKKKSRIVTQKFAEMVA
jgi:hypothetical protein